MRKIFDHKQVELTEMEAVTTEEGRKYHTPEGVDLPSITTCLSILSRDGIAAWRRRVGDEEANRISRVASTRGTKVHEIIEKYIDNKEDYKDGYTPDIIQSLNDVRDILDNRIGTVFAQEAPLYSNHLGVAGRVDCVAEFDGALSIIDFKTSRKKKFPSMIKQYFMQESAYSIMWEERTGMPITQLVTIIAVDNHEPQVFIEHRDNWVRPLKETIAQYNEENTSVQFL
jgi:genome maintenance exonuclease 1|tara:strand:- start:228 stop:911 length:684 start_codon:yes stop_codon:yes gene_type:complete